MTPGIVLGVLLSVSYASVFHLWGGRSLRDLGVFLIVALAGFGVGQVIGIFTDLELLRIGPVHALEATIVAWAGLVLAKLVMGE